MGEFHLIERFFKRPTHNAVLVEGRHFLSTVDPFKLGHKALAVNLSDLAACGAKPLAFTLALALPRADEAWLAPFSQGLFELADLHGCELVGGDTTQGPLNICITVFGEVPVIHLSLIHISEPTRLGMISYAVFCLKKKT